MHIWMLKRGAIATTIILENPDERTHTHQYTYAHIQRTRFQTLRFTYTHWTYFKPFAASLYFNGNSTHSTTELNHNECTICLRNAHSAHTAHFFVLRVERCFYRVRIQLNWCLSTDTCATRTSTTTTYGTEQHENVSYRCSACASEFQFCQLCGKKCFTFGIQLMSRMFHGVH